MKTVVKYAPVAVNKPDDYEARANLMWASSWALNNFLYDGFFQATVCRSMEHELSAFYDITHGYGLAILTPRWLSYVLDEETAPIIKRFGVNVMSSRESILAMIAKGQEYGEIKYLVNGAGVSPSQAPVEAILKVDLYGTAVLLEEVGKVIAKGGCGVTISSQSGWRMPQLTAEQDYQLAMTPTEKLLDLDILKPENIRDTLHAYQMAKRCNEKRVMAECVKWGQRDARLNDIAPGIIVTPLAIDELGSPRGDFYKNMFAKCPAGRPGTADEVANVAELLMSDKGAFITGSTFLCDGGATSSYFYGPLKPTG